MTYSLVPIKLYPKFFRKKNLLFKPHTIVFISSCLFKQKKTPFLPTFFEIHKNILNAKF